MNSMNLADASGSKIEAFLSYSHAADRFLKLAEPLHRDLVDVIKMRSNRDIEIFRDRQDIKWGDRWKSTIDSGLTNASVLFVIATPQYLSSNNCRDEFLDFLNAARSSEMADARRLILPIMPIRSSVFTDSSEDEIAKEIVEIQFELIEDAVTDGPNSPAWTRALLRLADRFIEVVTHAEEQAISAENESPAKASEASKVSGADSSDTDEATEELGYLEAISKVEDDFDELTELAQKLSGLMGTVISPVNDVDLSAVSSAKEMSAKMALIANKMTPDSKEIGTIGRQLRDKASSIDVTIRALVRIAQDESTFTDQVHSFLVTAQESMKVTKEVQSQMDSLLTSMAPAEAASSLMRNALKPMRSGIVAFGDAIRIMRKWGPELLD